MAIVQPKHAALAPAAGACVPAGLCAAVVFPFAIVLSVSLRPGNFASGSLIPQAISLEHWRYVLGLPYPGPDGTLDPARPAGDALVVELIKVAAARPPGDAAAVHHRGLRAGALALQGPALPC
jgi:hypothetical protein